MAGRERFYKLTADQLSARLETDKLMSMSEAAEMISLHRSTIWSFHQRGLLPAVKYPGNRLRVFKSDVLEILAVNVKKEGLE